MKAYGKLIPCHANFCLIHSIHLAVVKTFYSKKFDPLSSENHDENQPFLDPSLTTEFIAHDCILKDEIDRKLEALRYTIKYFNKSIINRGSFERICSKTKRKKTLFVDVPTRWNSILSMIRRSLELQDCIKEAAIEAGKKGKLYDTIDFEYLTEMAQCLEPLEEGILVISTTDLLSAEGVLKFIFEQLSRRSSSFSIQISRFLETEILKRRDKPIVSTLKVLQNLSFDFLKEESRFGYSDQETILNTATIFYSRLFPSCDSENLEEDDLVSEIQTNDQPTILSFIQKENTIKKKQKKLTIAEEMMKSVQNQELSGRLKELRSALLTIPPSSVSCEQTFSACSLFATKQRNLLSDEIFDALVFLKYDFIEKKKENNQKNDISITVSTSFQKTFNFYDNEVEDLNTRSVQKTNELSDEESDLYFLKQISGRSLNNIPFRPASIEFLTRVQKQLNLKYVYLSEVPNLKATLLSSPTKRINIMGDGNCLYRSLSFMLTGTEDNHSSIRAVINKEKEGQWEAHEIEPRKQDGTWGGLSDLYVFSRIIRANIYVYMAAEIPPKYWNSNSTKYPIDFALHYSGQHFDIIDLE